MPTGTKLTLAKIDDIATINLPLDMKAFREHLSVTNFSPKTQDSYYSCVTYYAKLFPTLSISNMLAFKAYMIDKELAAQTINLRLRGVNYYAEWATGNTDLHVTFVKCQRKTYIEDAITDKQFRHLISMCEKHESKDWMFLALALGTTGARISEALRFTVGDVRKGYSDQISKGTKMRRIFFPSKVQKKMLKNWFITAETPDSKKLFNWSDSVINGKWKVLFKRYKLPMACSHSHSFRHYWARTFYSSTKDLALMCDLGGWDSVDIARVYLQKTSREQADAVNKCFNKVLNMEDSFPDEVVDVPEAA